MNSSETRNAKFVSSELKNLKKQHRIQKAVHATEVQSSKKDICVDFVRLTHQKSVFFFFSRKNVPLILNKRFLVEIKGKY